MPRDLDPSSPPRWRNVADFLAILVGMSLIGVALYGGPLIDRTQIRNVDAVWMTQLVSGALAVAGVGLAQWFRWRSFGRALIMIAGVLLLGGLAFFSSIGLRAWLMSVLPGILLIGLSRLIGPIQAP